MKTIKLHSWLGKRYGGTFELDVASPAEAIQALCALLPGFRRDLAEDTQGFTLWVDDENKGPEDLAAPFSDREVMHLVPVVAGAKEGGIGQIILGIVLIVAAPYMAPYLAGLGVTSAGIAAFGVSMVLGGISQMLFSPPEMKLQEKPENKPSYAFSGAVNTVQQGNCVPVLYGELITGSQVISAGLFVEEVAV